MIISGRDSNAQYSREPPYSVNYGFVAITATNPLDRQYCSGKMLDMPIVSKEFKPEEPSDVLKSMGLTLRYWQYVYVVEQAQKLGISMSEYIRDLVSKDYNEQNEQIANKA